MSRWSLFCTTHFVQYMYVIFVGALVHERFGASNCETAGEKYTISLNISLHTTPSNTVILDNFRRPQNATCTFWWRRTFACLRHDDVTLQSRAEAERNSWAAAPAAVTRARALSRQTAPATTAAPPSNSRATTNSDVTLTHTRHRSQIVQLTLVTFFKYVNEDEPRSCSKLQWRHACSLRLTSDTKYPTDVKPHWDGTSNTWA